jgi:serine O-acetyltransferase
MTGETMPHTADSKFIEGIVKELTQTYTNDSGTNFIDVSNLPVREKVLGVLDLIFEVLFPGYAGKRAITKANISFIVGDMLCNIYSELSQQIENALKYRCRAKNCSTGDCHNIATKATEALIAKLPYIREMLKTDVEAAFAGDPAAESFEEIVVSYPCIIAIGTHRIAHELYKMEVPLIPRMMSESAHKQTGIDINPGATIGKYFFIDHGTGVVIGETAIIGEHVQMYQGVTLGALAPAKGQSLRGKKRHPTIEDSVTIYAEATILGDIIIGNGSVIGGNVSVRESVPPYTVVTTPTPELIYRQHKKK